ncbi:uncharacterized protein E0L32_002688 [Thyridium curvatum]|uniref:DNA replication regulator SLD2 n=1 Tax=Thyridium curvatum TaxID=1093900 RepID=A0A507BL12_9PEZI|nr:uncharacterized protein E0L32_002688 [Thyridium curvatum]TPX18179.1 hypothetical protein E0L32_002688 [Thyridium curvatum]
MDVAERERYEKESQDLRVQLKTWENTWAKEHEGKKPSRDAIKQNPDIAQKYKTYNRLRDIISGKIPPPQKNDSQSRKRKSAPATETPSKKTRTQTQTPSNARFQNHPDAVATPSTARKLFSPAVPTSIGPTPQRDGRVLGLFDLLPSAEAATPSRSTGEGKAQYLAGVQATPSKQTGTGEVDSDTKLGRTPVSSGKRNMLDSFMTPLKNRDANSQGLLRTPGSVSKLQFATPAFLRRAPLAPVDENGAFKSPDPIRLPRKPLVRGLSSVVASLRKLEEEKLDDDLEALHEMENEMNQPKRTAKAKPEQDDTIVEDSQVHLPLGGFDDEGMYDSAPEEGGLDRGQPLKVYKKKGQKRTTRRVNMRPSRAKRPALGNGDEDEVVPETQVDTTTAGADGAAADDVGSGSEFADSGDEGQKPAKKTAAPKDGKIKRAAKKVNELAHANFKRLKLRNNGSKGGPGYNSKFRRRR